MTALETAIRCDIRADVYGELWILTPQNLASRDFLIETISTDALWYSGGLVVEGRYLYDVLDAIFDAGMVIA